MVKYINSFLFALCVLLSFSACEREEDITVSVLEYVNENIITTYSSADITCALKCIAPFRSASVHYALDPEFTDYKTYTMTMVDSLWHATLTMLEPDTVYYVRYEISNRISSLCSKKYSKFRTITSSDGNAGGYHYVDLGLSVKWAICNVGASRSVEYGDYFAWGEVEPKTTYNWSTYKWCNGDYISKYNVTIFSDMGPDLADAIVPGDYKSVLDSVDDVAAVEWGGNWRIPTNSEWTELYENCTWIWMNLKGINGYLVTSKNNGNNIFLPATGIYEESTVNNVNTCGFYWSSSTYLGDPSYAYEINFDPTSIASGSRSYRYRGYAIRPIYDIRSKPLVVTMQMNEITETTAVAGGTVTNDGNANVTERGVCISTVSNPTTSNTKITAGSGIGSFTCNLTGLQANTTYYVRAYAVNSKGTAYGEQVSFTTNKTVVLPSVTTSAITQITQTTAVAGGSVTADGNASVTERGVVYSTVSNPVINNIYHTTITSGSGTGSFSVNLTNLVEGTTYYVRAYATNEKGTAYGEEVSFTINKNIVLPSITTNAITQIIETSAVAGGNVTSDGNASVTERGVMYSTNPNRYNTFKPCGSGTGSFTCDLTNLQPNTTYYLRAYATNSMGTAYGEEVSFTTEEKVVDNPPSNLTAMPFSVSESKQVYFSKGNLQYHPANNEWRFAESQLEYVGYANSNISDTYNGWLDLFGWSTNATNFGVSTSTNNNDYSGDFVDWGTNQIGSDAPNTWRTLTDGEWKYLRFTRTNADALCGVAQVNGVTGLVFLPDSWICPEGVTFKSGFHSSYGADYYAVYQTFTAEQWSKLEGAGAVFLPASGGRNGSYVFNVQEGGYYWSATDDRSLYAYCLGFSSYKAYVYGYNRYCGQSVRLVKDL